MVIKFVGTILPRKGLGLSSIGFRAANKIYVGKGFFCFDGEFKVGNDAREGGEIAEYGI